MYSDIFLDKKTRNNMCNKYYFYFSYFYPRGNQ